MSSFQSGATVVVCLLGVAKSLGPEGRIATLAASLAVAEKIVEFFNKDGAGTLNKLRRNAEARSRDQPATSKAVDDAAARETDRTRRREQAARDNVAIPSDLRAPSLEDAVSNLEGALLELAQYGGRVSTNPEEIERLRRELDSESEADDGVEDETDGEDDYGEFGEGVDS